MVYSASTRLLVFSCAGAVAAILVVGGAVFILCLTSVELFREIRLIEQSSPTPKTTTTTTTRRF